MDRLSFEVRGATLEGNTLSGMAHVFGTRALVRGSYEAFARGAFDEALKASDVRAFFNHDTSMLLGRQSSGTLRIEATDEGLAFSIDLPDTSYGRDVRALVERGDLTEMSFGFVPGKARRSTAPDGLSVRTHTSVKSLVEVSPVALPAFPGTSVALRSEDQTETRASQLVRARARARSKQQ
jgi:HK97 family phage prohead protease